MKKRKKLIPTSNSFIFDCGSSELENPDMKTIPVTSETTYEFSISVDFKDGKRVVTSSEPISDAAVDLIFPPWIQEIIKKGS